jgi:hypothetical protein
MMITKTKASTAHQLEWEYVPGLVRCDERMREWRVRYGEDCGVLMYYGRRKGEQFFSFAMAHEPGGDSPLYQHPFVVVPGKTYDEVIEGAKMISAELFTTHTPKELWDMGEPWVIKLVPPKKKISGRKS